MIVVATIFYPFSCISNSPSSEIALYLSLLWKDLREQEEDLEVPELELPEDELLPDEELPDELEDPEREPRLLPL